MSNNENRHYNKNQLLMILKEWDLTPIYMRKIAIGDSTSNWVVKTKTKKYILRDAGKHEQYVKFQIFLLKKLRLVKFPYKVPVVIKNLSGKYNTQLNGHFFFVYDFIDGNILGSDFTRDQAEQLGSVVGSYHKNIGKLFKKTIRSKNIFDSDHVFSSLFEVSFKIKQKKNPGRMELVFLCNSEDIIDALKSSFSRKVVDAYYELNKVPCYSDWNGTNLIIDSDDKIIGVIDFGGIHMEPRIFDFQNALLYASLDKSKLNFKKIIFFCKGYLSSNIFSLKEVDLIYPAMLFDLTFTLAWIFEEKLKNNNCRIQDWDLEVRLNVIVWLIKNERVFKSTIREAFKKQS